MLRKGLFSSFIVMVLISLVIAGCSNSGGNSKPLETKKEEAGTATKIDNKITIVLKNNFNTLDPQDSGDKESSVVQESMFEGLVTFDKDMKIVPVLAESYEISSDAKVISFKLRKGVKFHDGEPFNAAAVKANIDRVSNPANKLRRYSLFETVEKTEVIDAQNVKIFLKASFGAMINNFAHPGAMMMSPKSVEKYGKDVSQHPVGTGPFKFVEWVQGDQVVVDKNSDYWQKGLPKVDKITYKAVGEDGTRIAMLKTGEADIIFPFPTEQEKSLTDKDHIIVENSPSITVRYLSMNTMKKPFNDIRVRQAVNYAISKEALVKTVFQGHAAIADSVIAQNVQFYSKQKPYEYNIAKAKQLLKEAGYENGFETEIWSGNSSSSTKAMEFLQQQLTQVGIKVKVVPMESGTLSDKAFKQADPNKAEVGMLYGSWTPSTGEAGYGIRPLFTQGAFPPNNYNVAYYTNSKVEELVAAGQKTNDPEKLNAIYAEAQKIIWDEAPWAFLAIEQNTLARKDYISGFTLLTTRDLNVTNIEIKK